MSENAENPTSLNEAENEMPTTQDPNLAPASTDADLAKSPEPVVGPGNDESANEGSGVYIPEPETNSEAEYVADLAARIKESGFAVTKVAHKDYVKLVRDGFVNNEDKTLIANGKRLLIDEDPNAATGTYWQVEA